MRVKKKLLLTAMLISGSVCLSLQGQIVNRLNVDKDIFLRYAYGRMQQYNPSNIILADSIYAVGVAKENSKLRALALALELPARYAQNDTVRMDTIVKEIKAITKGRKDMSDFYFSTMYDFCNMQLNVGRVSDAMLEARAMSAKASEEKNALGHMYAYRIIGLIQMYRSNSPLAVENFKKAGEYCLKADMEQELPNIYILIAQEMIKMKHYDDAVDYCKKAEAYQDFFPSLRVKATMTKAYLYNSQGNVEAFWECYDRLINDPVYAVQIDDETRNLMDICWLRSKKLFEEALQKADKLGTARSRYEQKYGLYAELGDYTNAYGQLHSLMHTKDSIYIAVQNEDMAILDAELNNARLRLEAEQLKAQNELTIFLGIVVFFIIVFVSVLYSQWQLRQNIEDLKKRNRENLYARDIYRAALDAKEMENQVRMRLLQNNEYNNILI